MDATEIDRRLAGKTVLVTGAGGFVGSAVAARLARTRCRLLRVANRPLAPLAAAGAVVDIAGGLQNLADWQAALAGADVIVHLAAQTSVYAAIERPVEDLLTNAGGVAGLARAAASGGKRPHLVIAGTVTEAGLTPKTPVDESFPDQPITFYDLSKLTAERYLRLCIAEGWVTGAALRLANIFGLGSSTAGGDRGVLNKITRMAFDGKEITIFGHGRYLRDFVHVDDVAEAFAGAAAAPERVSGEAFIVASGKGVLLRDAFAIVIDEVAARTGRRVPLRQVEPPAGLSPIEFRDFIGDPAKLRRAIGWRATIDLRCGIRRMVEAYASENA